jgi:DNA-binding FrmR family transcriptional regulator
MSHLASDRTKLLARVRRLKGQIEAVERAVETDAECGKILHLVASIRGAMNGLTAELIEDHINHHIRDEADPDTRRKGTDDLAQALRTYLK